jgi:phosphatidylserine decarboxylase
MRLTQYGKDVVLKAFIIGLALNLLAIFIQNTFLKFLFTGIAIFLWLFTLYFFRDPERKLPPGLKENQIVSPADGKIVVIEDVVSKEKTIFDESEQLKQISIFLSPLNVHVNRIPMTGVVKFLKYVKGDFVAAFDKRASEKNERSEIGIENESTGEKILFRQIAGFVARRIVCELTEDCRVIAGEKFGMIKFGSRVDIFLKRDSKILVSINQKVVGGETLIAEL